MRKSTGLREILAYEVTKLVHGEDGTPKTQDAAGLSSQEKRMDDVPKTVMPAEKFEGEGVQAS